MGPTSLLFCLFRSWVYTFRNFWRSLGGLSRCGRCDRGNSCGLPKSTARTNRFYSCDDVVRDMEAAETHRCDERPHSDNTGLRLANASNERSLIWGNAVTIVKVLLGLALVVAPFQICDCLKTRRISVRFGEDIFLRDRPQAYWAYIGLYCLLVPILAVLLVVLPNK